MTQSVDRLLTGLLALSCETAGRGTDVAADRPVTPVPADRRDPIHSAA
jgi:hypothetical protein